MDQAKTTIRRWSAHRNERGSWDIYDADARGNIAEANGRQDGSDARLIAAAPELLACVEEMERVISFEQEEEGFGDRLRAAIKAATGEEIEAIRP